MTFDLSQIDLTSLEVVNNTFPEHEFRVGYVRVTDGAIYFSIEGNYCTGTSRGRNTRFWFNIYMDGDFTAEDFVVENDKALIKNFRPSSQYEYGCYDLDVTDMELDEIKELIDEHVATPSCMSNYTLIAKLKQN